MTWKDITVEHYQLIYPFIVDKSITEIERDCEILCILKGLTEPEIDRMPYGEFQKMRAEISFLHDDRVPAKPVKIVKTKSGATFSIIHDVRKMPIARYVEIKHFAGDEREIVRNLHLIFASMVIPSKKTFLGWKEQPYDASAHADYAKDILTAPFMDVFYTMVFFCNLYANWMRNSQDYLVQSLIHKGKMNKEQATVQVKNLCNVSDGFIISNRLPIIKTSPWMQPGKRKPSKH